MNKKSENRIRLEKKVALDLLKKERTNQFQIKRKFRDQERIKALTVAINQLRDEAEV